jgi:hypothetical protein
MPQSPQPKVAVSYSWKEERTGLQAGAVDQFCEALRKAGVEVVRDLGALSPGECISEFMRSLGASDFICVFLNQAYLKSPNCMYELLIAWQRSKDHAPEFRRRVKVWVMDDVKNIHKIDGRLEFLDYWLSEKNRVEPLINKYVTVGLSAATVDEYRRIKEIGEVVEPMLKFFTDTLSAGSAEEFQTWIKAQFPRAAGELDGDTVARVYANTITEIEVLLNRQPSVPKFLSAVTTGLLQEEAAGWKLAAVVQGRHFDVCPHLEKIARGIDSFNAPPRDWRALGEVAGGLVVLAMDRAWVLHQKHLARMEAAGFPGDDEAVGLGGGRRANLLHLVTSALADGRARLEKVFGKPPLDEFRIPDVPELLRGIGTPDHIREVQLHFIRFVLGQDEPIDPANPEKLERQLDRTKKIIAAAFHDDHTAYFAAGNLDSRLTKLIREHLKLEDLLLIYPSGDDPELLLIDYVRVLRFLGKIFDAVQANAAQ